ncbi:MAG: hypothetical protein PHU94_00660 [Bacilli bacterium]|nr:hypothetical protein [Bacilli bacterium]MDD4733439.1 hypothetical protein [Bacilli bacterium]
MIRNKSNLMFIVVLVLFIIIFAYDHYQHYIFMKQLINETNNFVWPDAMSNFGYVIPHYFSYRFFIFFPLFVIIFSAIEMNKMIKKGNLKNTLVRSNYSEYMKKTYSKSLKYSFVLPLSLIVSFIVSIAMTKNFDVLTSIENYKWATFFSREQLLVWPITLILFLANITFFNVYFVNLGLIFLRKSKHVVISILSAYITFFLIELIIQTVTGYPSKIEVSYGSIYNFSDSIVWIKIAFSFFLMILTSFIVFLLYRKKEKLIIDCE